ncbi:MAG: fructose-bisphosphate aldolase [Sphaerochaeta sp.]
MRRMDRIFRKDGKTVIVAIDHGMSLSVNPALNDLEHILQQIIAGGADALLLPYGVACKYEDILRDVAVIIRMDGGTSQLGSNVEGPSLLFSMEDVLRIGADGVACMGFPGTSFEQKTIENLSLLASEGKQWGIPVLSEMLPGGFGSEPPKTVENLCLAVHIGCDHGANIIKTTYAGTREEFKKVIDASYQPVVILGGEKTKDLKDLFECIENAISAGAAGVAIGRNVWKHPDPKAVVEALVKLVHEGKAAKDIVL